MWGDLLERVHHPAETVRIAVVGKYIDLPDAYLSVTEALRAGGFGNNARVEIVWVASDDCIDLRRRRRRAGRRAGRADPRRVRRPRHRGQDRRDQLRPDQQDPDPGPVPRACSAWSSRRPATWPASAVRTPPSSTPNAADPVIATMADQHDVVAGAKDMGGTMRLGAYPARLAEGSLVAEIYGSTVGFRAAPAPLRGQQRLPGQRWKQAGLHLSGTSPDSLAGRVRRAGPGAAPVPGRHPGPPGVQVPADPAAPAVRGVRPGRPGLPGVRATADRRRPTPRPGRSPPRSWWPARSPGEPAAGRRPSETEDRAPRCSRSCPASGCSTARSPPCGSTRW